MLFKIDGGPGRLDMPMLAELRSLGVWGLSGSWGSEHNKNHTRKRPQHGKFKSLLQKHKQLNKMYSKYHQQLQEQVNTEGNAPSASPTLN